MTTLESIMTRHVVTVKMDDSLETIKGIFERFRFHHVVVLDKCCVVGVITDRDLLTNLSPFVGKPFERTLDSASLRKRAHQIMTREVVTATAGMVAGDAALLMLNNGISCLPVLDQVGACVGIVTWRDLLRWALEHLGDNACSTIPRERKAA